MNRKLLLEKLTELPEAAQQQVLDYIAFLHTRYGIKQNEPPIPASDLSSEPFVGMWRDRSDMQDSTRWVRESRQSEW
jgi:hypothetical protein